MPYPRSFSTCTSQVWQNWPVACKNDAHDWTHCVQSVHIISRHMVEVVVDTTTDWHDLITPVSHLCRMTRAFWGLHSMCRRRDLLVHCSCTPLPGATAPLPVRRHGVFWHVTNWHVGVTQEEECGRLWLIRWCLWLIRCCLCGWSGVVSGWSGGVSVVVPVVSVVDPVVSLVVPVVSPCPILQLPSGSFHRANVLNRSCTATLLSLSPLSLSLSLSRFSLSLSSLSTPLTPLSPLPLSPLSPLSPPLFPLSLPALSLPSLFLCPPSLSLSPLSSLSLPSLSPPLSLSLLNYVILAHRVKQCCDH